MSVPPPGGCPLHRVIISPFPDQPPSASTSEEDPGDPDPTCGGPDKDLSRAEPCTVAQIAHQPERRGDDPSAEHQESGEQHPGISRLNGSGSVCARYEINRYRDISLARIEDRTPTPLVSGDWELKLDLFLSSPIDREQELNLAARDPSALLEQSLKGSRTQDLCALDPEDLERCTHLSEALAAKKISIERVHALITSALFEMTSCPSTLLSRLFFSAL